MTDEEIMFARLFAPIKANIQDKNKYITYLEKENAEQKTQIEKYKIEKEYYDNLCHKKTIECDDLRKGINQFQSDNERFIKRTERLEEENKELNNQLYDLKESYNKIIDEVIETAKSYGLISETCLWQYISEYDSKKIAYDELYEKLLSVAVQELELAIVDMKKRL